jgi:2-polyprenyl-3-methyl-5-hydroxy-6-metoxy-1,4-benzoquinol methylase
MMEMTKLQLEQRAYEILKGEDKILDMGCGMGSFVSKDPARIEGWDWNSASVQYCRDKGWNVRKVDITEPVSYIYGAKACQLGGIHCSHVLEHMLPCDAYKVINNIDRLLKPGGIAVIRTPMMSSIFWDDFSHIKPYSPNALRHYFIREAHPQRNFDALRGGYKEIDFMWRTGKSGYLIAFQKNGA